MPLADLGLAIRPGSEGTLLCTHLSRGQTSSHAGGQKPCKCWPRSGADRVPLAATSSASFLRYCARRHATQLMALPVMRAARPRCAFLFPGLTGRCLACPGIGCTGVAANACSLSSAIANVPSPIAPTSTCVALAASIPPHRSHPFFYGLSPNDASSPLVLCKRLKEKTDHECFVIRSRGRLSRRSRRRARRDPRVPLADRASRQSRPPCGSRGCLMFAAVGGKVIATLPPGSDRSIAPLRHPSLFVSANPCTGHA